MNPRLRSFCLCLVPLLFTVSAFAQKKITELPEVTSLDSEDQLIVSQTPATPGATPRAAAITLDNLRRTAGVSTITPDQYGAEGDGVTDDTVAVQAAITAAQAINGVVEGGGKTYKVTSQINGTAAITLENIVLLTTATTGDVLHFAPATPPTSGTGDTLAGGIRGLVFRNVEIQSTVTRASGFAIYTQYTIDALFDNVQIGHFDMDPAHTLPFYDGIYLSYCGNPVIRSSRIYMRHHGVVATGDPTQRFFQYGGLITDATEIWGNFATDSVALHLAGDTGGFKIDGASDLSTVEIGILVDRTIVDAPNRELFLSDCFVDSLGKYGVYVAANSCVTLHGHNVWIAGSGRMASGAAGEDVGVGLVIRNQGANSVAEFTGGKIYYNAGHGVLVDGQLVTFTGLDIEQNGLSEVGGGDGIAIMGGGVVTVTGGAVYNNRGANINFRDAFSANLTGVNLASAAGHSQINVANESTIPHRAFGNLGHADTPDFDAAVSTRGEDASFNFYDRTTPTVGWTWYSDANIAHLFNANGNIWSIALDGSLTLPSVTATSGTITNGAVSWKVGTGSPEGVVTAGVGSLFTRTDGGTSTTLYVKTSGAGNTGWTAK